MKGLKTLLYIIINENTDAELNIDIIDLFNLFFLNISSKISNILNFFVFF